MIVSSADNAGRLSEVRDGDQCKDAEYCRQLSAGYQFNEVVIGEAASQRLFLFRFVPLIKFPPLEVAWSYILLISSQYKRDKNGRLERDRERDWIKYSWCCRALPSKVVGLTDVELQDVVDWGDEVLSFVRFSGFTSR